MPLPPPPQTELALDHTQALEPQMRQLFESRWARWHPKPFDEAMKDPVTRRLLVLAVQHQPAQPDGRRPRGPRRFLNVPRAA
jgi:hypothetical protein